MFPSPTFSIDPRSGVERRHTQPARLATNTIAAYAHPAGARGLFPSEPSRHLAPEPFAPIYASIDDDPSYEQYKQQVAPYLRGWESVVGHQRTGVYANSKTIDWALHDGLVVTKRNLLQIPRVPELLVFSTIQPVMFVLLSTLLTPLCILASWVSSRLSRTSGASRTLIPRRELDRPP